MTDMCVADPYSEEALSRRFGLTARESQIARLLLQRVTNKEIAEALRISTDEAGRVTAQIVEKLLSHARRRRER